MISRTCCLQMRGSHSGRAPQGQVQVTPLQTSLLIRPGAHCRDGMVGDPLENYVASP